MVCNILIVFDAEHGEAEHAAGRAFEFAPEGDFPPGRQQTLLADELKILPVRILQQKDTRFRPQGGKLQLRIGVRTQQPPDTESGGSQPEISIENKVWFRRIQQADEGEQ